MFYKYFNADLYNKTVWQFFKYFNREMQIKVTKYVMKIDKVKVDNTKQLIFYCDVVN